MTYIDFLFNIFGIISIIDLCIRFYKTRFSKYCLYYCIEAQSLINQFKYILELIMSINYICYIVYKLFFNN